MLYFKTVEYDRKIGHDIKGQTILACAADGTIFKSDASFRRIGAAIYDDCVTVSAFKDAIFVGDRNRFGRRIKLAEYMKGIGTVVIAERCIFNNTISEFMVRMIGFKVDPGFRRETTGVPERAVSDPETVDGDERNPLTSLLGNIEVLKGDIAACFSLVIPDIETVTAGALKFQIFDGDVGTTGKRKCVPPFGLAVNLAVEVIVFIDYRRILFSGNGDITDTFTGEHRVLNAVKSIVTRTNHHIFIKNDVFIAPQDERIDDPVASRVVNDQITMFGIQSRLDAFCGIDFIKAET